MDAWYFVETGFLDSDGAFLRQIQADSECERDAPDGHGKPVMVRFVR